MIQIKDLKVNLGGFLLQDITLDVNKGEYFIILGPTGAGKTVLLEAIAGLYPILQGSILANGKDITWLKPEKREIAMVYQEQALFPHLSVEENIAFGLKARKYPKKEISPKVQNIAELLGAASLLKRNPTTLSGGEKQRVALARALVTEPAVLLLDEPLSALDPENKERMQQELAEIHRRIKVTTIHVTHDFEEAITLGDRVAVLNEGRIAQIGTPDDVLRRPNSEFVAKFSLSRNIFSGTAQDNEDGYVSVGIDGTKLMGITEMRGAVHLSLRPEDILVSKEPFQSTARNHFEGTITEIIDRGAVIYLTVNVPPDFICLVTRQSFTELELSKGMKVWITFKSTAMHVF